MQKMLVFTRASRNHTQHAYEYHASAYHCTSRLVMLCRRSSRGSSSNPTPPRNFHSTKPKYAVKLLSHQSPKGDVVCAARQSKCPFHEFARTASCCLNGAFPVIHVINVQHASQIHRMQKSIEGTASLKSFRQIAQYPPASPPSKCC